MTREELLKEVQLSHIENMGFYQKELVDIEHILKYLQDKVIIKKGDIRHPCADALHGMAEGEPFQYKDRFGLWKDAKLHVYFEEEYRLTPSEPIYEYQYLRIDGDSAYPTEDFLTEEEAKALGLKIRLENTKKPRQ